MKRSIVTLLALVLVALAAPLGSPAHAVAVLQREQAPYEVSSFKPRPSDPARLTRAWQAWRATRAEGGARYSTTVERGCFCPPQRAIVTEVRGRTVTSVTYEGGERQLRSHGYEMSELFLLLRKAFAKAERLQVRFTRDGVPASIYVDWDDMIADEEFSLSVKLTQP